MSLFDSIPAFLAADPAARMLQGGVAAAGVLLLFLLFWTVRDILLRTHSFWYQAICVALVAVLPGVGFLVYLLIRPARTIKQREVETMLRELFSEGEPTPEEAVDSVDESPL